MKLSHFKEPLRHWGSSDSNVTQAQYHCFEIKSPFEAIAKFSQVSRKMFLADGVEGSMESFFDIANNGSFE